jgi:hypothetical protein
MSVYFFYKNVIMLHDCTKQPGKGCVVHDISALGVVKISRVNIIKC